MPLLSRLAVQAARAYGILSAADKTKVSASYLVVAGGGSGGSQDNEGGGGGGGAGGLLANTTPLSTLTTYTITVGGGGAQATPVVGVSPATGNDGSASSISGTGLTTITSTGGGGGAFNGTGRPGGSGGGIERDVNATNTTGTGIAGQGFAGGNIVNNTGYQVGSGGGGAGAVGANGTGSGSSVAGGNGGAGVASSISGSSVTYAGGGGGSADNRISNTLGSGGAGGGGAATNGTGTRATAGTANTGGGGGGSGGAGSGAGGSGIVIISYASATPKFVGGTLTTSGGNQIHTFTSSGTLSPITPVTASYLVVAGGGGGATNTSAGASGGVGGGGAGGLRASTTTLYSGGTYIITVGAGGAGASSSGASGTQGSTTSLAGTGLTTLSASGGGGGAGTTAGNGLAGGSGGGGYGYPLNTYNGGAGNQGGYSPVEGYAGGKGYTDGSTYTTGGGGGGAGAAATQKTSNSGGDGGVGVQSSITGTATYYAGGGGGGAGPSGAGGTGGLGGGGNGSVAGASASSGTPNSGGGGGGVGGGSSTVYVGGSGGSGTVIISYAGSQIFNGGLVTSSGGNTIHTFNATGALTPLTNNLTNSLRFRNSASASLTRTPTLASNRRTFTLSMWVKRGLVNAGTSPHQFLYSASTSSTFTAIDLYANNIRVNFGNGTYLLVTSAVYRDPSAWYHIVLSVDTTQATNANRVKLYINGNQQSFASGTYPTQNYDTSYNNTVAQRFGVNDASDYFDGYMTDINFIDGQALEPYYFGNNDANGVWKPILYKGTYGTNGFYLTFGNTTSTTTLGYDSSGNNNNWTTNNISLTAGVTYDAMTDVPTNTSATVANYCTLNPLNKNTNATVSNANLTVTTAITNAGISGTIYMPSTGKYYWEATCTTRTNYPIVGIVNTAWSSGTNALTYPGATSGSYGYANDGTKYNNGSNTSYGASYTSGDIIGVAYDADTGTLTFYKNNTSQGAAYTGLTDIYAPAVSGQGSDVWNMNFGQRPFSYTPPTGFVALNTFNLPTPTILQGNKYMDATLYTGNGSSQTIVNAGQFKPDFVWIKRRDGAGQDHVLQDSNRGFGATTKLASSSTAAENTTGGATGSEWGYVTAANSNGFNITASTNGDQANKNTWTYAGWQWQAGQGSTSSNTSGSITSTVSVNATAGFSIVTYTGTGANATVGHGLGVAPRMIFIKTRSNIANWYVGHSSLTSWVYAIEGLNTTNGQSSQPNTWNSTAPTSTVFSIGTEGGVNTNTRTYVAYCWADVSGFSKAFSYTGNGSTDGSFVYLGFRPKFVMIKCSSTSATNWIMFDTIRNTYNYIGNGLTANSSNGEGSYYNYFDFLSNGFKARVADSDTNASGATYIGMAWAENPFKNSNAR